MAAGGPPRLQARLPGVGTTSSPGRAPVDALSPQLGQHSREVLRELSYSDDAIDALIAAGAVKTADAGDPNAR